MSATPTAREIDNLDAAQTLLSRDYFNRQELARELIATLRYVDRLRALRIGPPAVKIGKRLYFRKDAVLKWLRDQEDPGHFLGRRSAKIREAIA